jgi:hypothetical protein
VLLAFVLGGLVLVGTFAARTTQASKDTQPISDQSSPTVTNQTEVEVMDPAVQTPSISPEDFLSELYDAWSSRDTTSVERMVTPDFRDYYPNDLLDSQEIIGVTSQNTRITEESGELVRICGQQLFTKSNGQSQLESRCFRLQSKGDSWYLIWSGDQQTLRTWS